ncbi:MAG: hypothetical protein MJZ98_00620 [Paludibacteraceae bacterium]|nr:hypothetical protein [Paludibacteraceae bacterium]
MTPEEVFGIVTKNGAIRIIKEHYKTARYDGYTFDDIIAKGGYDYYIKQAIAYGYRKELEEAYNSMPYEPKVGDPATEILYSDTYGGEITEIFRNKKGKVVKVGFRKNRYKMKEAYCGDTTLFDDLEGGTTYYTLRRCGGWWQEGMPKGRGYVPLAIGYKRTFIDPSF